MFDDEPLRPAIMCVRCRSTRNERGEMNDMCKSCIAFLTGESDEDPKELAFKATQAALNSDWATVFRNTAS